FRGVLRARRRCLVRGRAGWSCSCCGLLVEAEHGEEVGCAVGDEAAADGLGGLGADLEGAFEDAVLLEVACGEVHFFSLSSMSVSWSRQHDCQPLPPSTPVWTVTCVPDSRCATPAICPATRSRPMRMTTCWPRCRAVRSPAFIGPSLARDASSPTRRLHP